MRFTTCLLLASAFCMAQASLSYGQTPLSADIVIAVGDPVGGGNAGPELISNLDSNPVVNTSNQLAISGDLSSGDPFLWYDTGILFRNSDALPTVLGGFETSYGIGEGGLFAFSPSIDGNDGIWTDIGPLVKDTDPAPGFPGQFISFGSRPTMTGNGTPYWISGISDIAGGSTLFRVLYKYNRMAAGDPYEIIASEGEIFSGLPIDNIAFDFFVSRNDAFIIWQPSLDTGSTADDDVLAIGGDEIAREGSPNGSPEADNWDNFDLNGINDSGAYAFSGDTDGVTTTDEFIAVGQAPSSSGGGVSIAMREGDTIDGVVVGGSVFALHVASTINFAGFAWSNLDASGLEGVFVGELSDLQNSTFIFREGDVIDTDGDMAADYTIDELITTSTAQVGGGLALSNDGSLYTLVDLIPVTGGPAFEALLRFDVSDIIPVELTRFTGVADGNAAILSWETSSETNNAGFEVQVRTPGAEFEMAGFVNGHGTTTEAHSYRHTVNELDPGTYAFRLKQIDYDGAFEYVGEVELEIGLPNSHVLSAAYPNPFNPTTQFTLAVAENQDVTLAVYDALGRQVALLHQGALDAGLTHTFTVDASSLASGAYVIRAIGERFEATRSITLLK